MTPAAVRFASLAPSPHQAAPADWLGYLVFLLLIGSVVVGVWFAWRAGRRQDHGADDSDEGEAGGGRGGPRRGPSPTGPSPDAEPEWWPEFERQFAAYLDSHIGRRGG